MFNIVANCHQTPAFISLNHFPSISVTLLVTGSTNIDYRLNLWQNISPISISMAANDYSRLCVTVVIDGYKHMDTSNLANHVIEMPRHRKYQSFAKCLIAGDPFSSFLQLISFDLTSPFLRIIL